MFVNLLKALCYCICDFCPAQVNVIKFLSEVKIMTFHEELKICI